MKLAKIVLPVLDNAGRDLFEVHRALQFRLLAEFGGYTSHEAVGGWKDGHGKLYNERVIVHEIAMDHSGVITLRDIALRIGRDARQNSVMIVTPNGDVEFVHPAAERVA